MNNNEAVAADDVVGLVVEEIKEGLSQASRTARTYTTAEEDNPSSMVSSSGLHDGHSSMPTDCEINPAAELNRRQQQRQQQGPTPAGGGEVDDNASENSWEETIESSTEDQLSVPSSGVRSSLRRSHNSKKFRGSNTSRNSSLNKKLLSEFTVNKLQFRKLGRLYGRDAECKILRDAWEAVRPTRRSADDKEVDHTASQARGRRLVTISGASGSGKSALAETLKGSVIRAGGFYLMGKFAQQRNLSRQSVDPYAAFASACNELCELVVSLYAPVAKVESDSFDGGSGLWDSESVASHKYYKFTLAEFRERLDSEVGADASILTRVIPGLLQILKAGGTSDSIGYREAHQQFKFAFRRFVRAVSSFGPVVLVLDDVQWADAASMELLEALLSDRESTSLLVVGCFRDDDIYSNTPHLKSIEHIRVMSSQDSSLKVESLSIGNLDACQVKEFLVDLLSLNDAEATGLAECVLKRTLGNIFFVIQFLTMLYDAELLVYNIGALKWTYDLQAVQLSTAATENVVSLVMNKMRNLPPSLVRFLPVMACLGSTFSASLFSLVVQHFAPTTAGEDPEVVVCSDDQVQPERTPLHPANHTALHCLARCQEEGLIEEGLDDGEGGYQWVHDKIQEAAFSLITEEELQELKLHLGRVLYENMDEADLEKHLFRVVNLLCTENPGEDTLPRLQPIIVAQLCLRAGVRTIENSAFEQAAGYLMTGISFLPAVHWTSNYDLSLDLYSTAAEAEFCTGNFEQMRLYCDEVLGRDDCPLLDKRRVYNVLIDYTAAELDMAAAFALCRTVLAKLGCIFPTSRLKAHTVTALIRIKVMLRRSATPEKILRLPQLTDEKQIWLMALLDKFTTYTYFTKPDLFALVVFKGFRSTLKYGISDFSPPNFALFGSVLTGVIQDYKGGLTYAKLAIDLLKHVKCARKVEARVNHVTQVLIIHWLRPLTQTIKPLLTGYQVGMAMGESAGASWCVYWYLEHSFRTGTSLEIIKADCEFYASQLREVKQLMVLATLNTFWQSVLHLTGDNPFSGLLTGDVVDQAKVLREMSEEDAAYMQIGIYRIQLYVQFLFGYHTWVYDCIRKTNMDDGHFEVVFPGLVSTYTCYAYNGLSMFSLYHETKEKKYLKLAKKLASKIKSWVKIGNPNVTHFDALLDAETESVNGRHTIAQGHYMVAILFSGRSGLTQDHALAHERLGEHLLRSGPDHAPDAEYHLNEALKLYEEWGSPPKVKQLRKSHPSVFGAVTEIQLEMALGDDETAR